VANQLNMALIDTILALHQQGWSQRRIASTLQIDRETVARYLRQTSVATPATPTEAPNPIERLAKPATPAETAPTAQTLDPSVLTANPCPLQPAESTPPAVSEGLPLDSGSVCATWHEVILTKLDQGLSVQRIWQDLVSEHGFTHKYHSVRRYVAKLQPGTPLFFRRLECGPAEEVQVDFGQGAWIQTADGKRRRPHVFRMVLSHSRKAYSEAVLRQNTDTFLLCLENAFWYFGGVCRRVVLDNLKAAVLQADWFDPELHPKLTAFGQHYGCVFLPTKPRTPRHKGKVERGVDYVQENALKGRGFSSLLEQNQFLLRWEAEVADVRVHGTTKQVVQTHFLQAEKPALLPLPQERFANFCEAQRCVHRDGHVEVNKAYYSVPLEYGTQTVWVRWDGHLVRVFNLKMVQIAVHAQQQYGKFSTQKIHIARAKVNAVEHGGKHLLSKVQLLGKGCGQWAEAMLQRRGELGLRVLQGLLFLAGKSTSEAALAQLDNACAVAHAHGEYRLRTIRGLLKHAQDKDQQSEAFVDTHPLIRPLFEYDQIVKSTQQQGDGGS
jgi:transposase